MKKSNYQDSDIEKILQQMPEVTDLRKSSQVLERAEMFSRKRKGFSWVIPAAASAAAILLFLLISTSFFQHERKAGNAGVNQKVELAAKEAPDRDDAIAEKRFTVMPDQKFITFSITGMDQAGPIMPLNVPISLIIDDNDSPAALYTKYINKLENDKWGLAPLDFKNHATFTEASDSNGKKKLIVNMIENSSLSVSSAGTSFVDSLRESFRWHGFSQIEFLTAGSKGATLGNRKYTSIPLVAEGKKAYFQYMYDQDFQSFLVPSPKAYAHFPDALSAMESESFNLQAPLHAPIPGGVDIKKISTLDGQAEVTFSADSGLLDNENFVMMLDSILLSAKEFGLTSVTFKGAENAGITSIGTIKLGTPVKVPAAPNPIRLK
ncbi:hypothetical protein CVD28_13960 [Bacillus sp. M6-12]|uniref:GerMN domain-containing protein n=1 Tax=Bacillus sp. M6-12 TaxID=2054166 RepID=UPI000C75B8D1|nr:GerMN domain-containing protein [Bacillus sp. M6-12]PLS17154.1 hypothetical protein CVD28_13960 [Bacillus sp. M6-12]